jgi:dehydrogenase/reductase SDR family protein 1
MAVDCGVELKKANVAMISLYPGAVKTELVTDLMNKNNPRIDNIESKKVKKNLTENFKSKCDYIKFIEE